MTEQSKLQTDSQNETTPARPDSGIGSCSSPEADRVTVTELDEQDGDDDPEFAEEHPLENRWSFWLNDAAKAWKDALTCLCTVSTVEEFWRVLLYLEDPSESEIYNYNFFKEGIKPEWEDPQNGKYGRWNIKTPLKGRDELNIVWEQLCMLVVGGKNLGALSAHVNGVYLSRKLNCFRASVWTRTKNKRQVMAIGKKIQETLRQATGYTYELEFVLHKSKSGRKTLHILPAVVDHKDYLHI